MRRAEPCLSILVLTEDAARNGHETIGVLIKRMLQLVESGCQTHRIEMEPANERAAAAVHGTNWKTRDPRNRQERVSLLQTIATKLREPGGTGFVFFHVDGDRRWSDQGACENSEKFTRYIREGVAQVLRNHEVPEAALEEALARLVLVMPFWSIEAWCYQNTRVASRLCHEHHSGADVSHFERWEKDRAALDEEQTPKAMVCLHDRHNQRLASESFPADEVYLAETSFAAVVDRLHSIEALRDALRRTWS